MKSTTSRLVTLTALCMASSTASADPWQCAIPSAGQPLPLSAILQKIEARGIRDIRELERKGRCYEIKARGELGRIKLYVKSSNGEIILEQERF
ncbi:MAG: PepSY domain-containing protein [Burkholderiales bacterium]|nr:PepSY domain-containing protein [Burkholderiales bacterium]